MSIITACDSWHVLDEITDWWLRTLGSFILWVWLAAFLPRCTAAHPEIGEVCHEPFRMESLIFLPD